MGYWEQQLKSSHAEMDVLVAVDLFLSHWGFAQMFKNI